MSTTTFEDTPPEMLRRLLPAGRVPHVCIVGAGMTGLRCAEVLIKNGFKVDILEGRGRMGGRIHQSQLGDHLVDLGPNWIHGTENNPILDIAREVKSSLHTWKERQRVLDEHGTLLDTAYSTDSLQRVWGIVAAAFHHSDENVDSIHADESLADFFRSSIDRLFDEDGEPHKALADGQHDREKQLLLWIAEFWGVIIGDPIQRQSLKFFFLEMGLDGENLFVADTYKDILANVAKLPLEKADVRYGKKVVGIRAAESSDEDGSVAVTTADGETREYDEVVVTAPLGWLKRNKEAFSPSLPPRLAQAIDAISYGNLEKFYLSFPRAFWRGPDVVVGGGGGGSDARANGSPQHQDAMPDGDGPGGNPNFFYWLHPLYAQDSNPQLWMQEAVDLSAVDAPHAQPTLLFYTFGPCSKHLTSLLAESPASSHDDLLKSFFEPYYSRLPFYSAESADCVPSAVLGTNWSADEMAGYGSYSNFQVGLTAADVDIEVMREGMPDRRIWLAGEHTAPFVASGTVAGAYWSGEVVAERIVVDAYGKSRVDARTYESVVVKSEP